MNIILTPKDPPGRSITVSAKSFTIGSAGKGYERDILILRDREGKATQYDLTEYIRVDGDELGGEI